MAIIDDYKTRFPQFDSTIVDDFLPTYIDTYQCYFGGDYDKSCDKEIILNLLAHLLFLDQGFNGGSGSSATPSKSVASKSVGNVSVSYAAATGNDSSSYNAFFGTTKYGQRYLMLTRHRFGAVFV